MKLVNSSCYHIGNNHEEKYENSIGLRCRRLYW